MSNSNPSLQKKTAARMAAAQGLYKAAITKEAQTPAARIAELKKQLEGNRDEQKLLVGHAVEPNYALLEQILAGVSERETDINQRIDEVVDADWSRARMSPLLVALLQCSIYEMSFGKEIKPAIVIDEYTRLTRQFFSDAEVNFVHGALAALAKKYHSLSPLPQRGEG